MGRTNPEGMDEDDAEPREWDSDRLIHNEQELCEAFGCTSLKDVFEILGDNLDIELDGFAGVIGDEAYLHSRGIYFPFTRADLERVGEEADAAAAAPTMSIALLEKLERVEGLAARVDMWVGLTSGA